MYKLAFFFEVSLHIPGNDLAPKQQGYSSRIAIFMLLFQNKYIKYFKRHFIKI